MYFVNRKHSCYDDDDDDGGGGVSRVNSCTVSRALWAGALSCQQRSLPDQWLH